MKVLTVALALTLGACNATVSTEYAAPSTGISTALNQCQVGTETRFDAYSSRIYTVTTRPSPTLPHVCIEKRAELGARESARILDYYYLQNLIDANDRAGKAVNDIPKITALMNDLFYGEIPARTDGEPAFSFRITVYLPAEGLRSFDQSWTVKSLSQTVNHFTMHEKSVTAGGGGQYSGFNYENRDVDFSPLQGIVTHVKTTGWAQNMSLNPQDWKVTDFIPVE